MACVFLFIVITGYLPPQMLFISFRLRCEGVPRPPPHTYTFQSAVRQWMRQGVETLKSLVTSYQLLCQT